MNKNSEVKEEGESFDFKKLIILLIFLLVGFGVWKLWEVNQTPANTDLLTFENQDSESIQHVDSTSDSKEDTVPLVEKGIPTIEKPKKEVLESKKNTKEVESEPKISKPVIVKKTKAIFPKIEMVNVQGGVFQMGSNKGGRDEKPIHTVTVSDFKIGKYEITQKIWKAVMGTNPSYFKGDSLPVEQVSWNKIQEFLKKLNTLTGKKYRLPTEAEWEFAAFGGNKGRNYRYSGSNILKNVAWNATNSDSKTYDVGTKKPNELGVCDMSGNVWEWCQDTWSDNYKETPTDGTVSLKNTSLKRIFRGGSWFSYPIDCRIAKRNCNKDTYSMNYLGFRVALAP
jgi:formylglycine-generating enzyme required for sulfatase activity